MMNETQQRVAGSFAAQGERFLAVGKVQNAGRSLTVCTGEVRAFAGNGPDYKVVALMQATMAGKR